MRPILIVVHKLGSGGVTQAVLDQVRMFSDAGRDVAIATLDDDLNFTKNIADLKESGRLLRSVPVLNIYEDSARRSNALRQYDSVPTATAGQATVSSQALAVARRTGNRLRGTLRGIRNAPVPSARRNELLENGTDSHGAYCRRFSTSGEYYAFDRLDDDGAVKHTNYFENRILTRRDEMADGIPARRTWFATNGEANRVEFMNPEGFIYAQRWISPEDGRGVGVYVADPASHTMRRFNGLPDWHVAWLQDIVDRYSTAPYVVAETASTITKMLKLDRSSAVRVAMMHNSHVSAPFNIDSPTRPDYDDTFAKLDKLDAFVVLSERQRTDMVDRLGCGEVFVVVPNALRIPQRPEVRRDPRLVSVVSRLAAQKALDEAIRSFALVLDDIPDARLEIYGRGPDKEKLQDLVTELGLGNQISLMGRTSDPQSVMARSTCTVSTSDWEALPLSIAESLVVGTPVVAYDCLYGPSALIKDGESGVIVPRGDRTELAQAVTRLLRSPSEAEEMGAVGRADIASRLSFDAVLREWDKAFAHADGRSGLRSHDEPG